MAEKKTQKTKPKKGEPVEIPIPERDQVMSDFEKVVIPKPESTQDTEDQEESD